MDKKQDKKCFIITPIGEVGSETYKNITGIIESIRPILKDEGFSDIKAAHEICNSGSINNQIVHRIMNDELVIANLSDNNPNVMYELCLRHVVAKPIIHICQVGTKLPFDIYNLRTIFFENTAYGIIDLKSKLQNFLDNINYAEKNSDNPIYAALTMEKELLPEASDYQIYLLKKILERLRGVTFDLNEDNFGYIDFNRTPAMTEVTICYEGLRIANTDISSVFAKLEDKLKELQLEFVDEEKDGGFYLRRKYRTYNNTWGRYLPQLIMSLAKDYGIDVYVMANTFL